MLLCLQIAFYWEGNDPKDEGKITYAELHRDVCKFANVLKAKGGVRKGDRVAIYMPMITELVVAMLACARYQTSSCIFYEHTEYKYNKYQQSISFLLRGQIVMIDRHVELIKSITLL